MLNQSTHTFDIRTKPKTRFAQTVRFLSEYLQVFVADFTQIGRKVVTAYLFSFSVIIKYMVHFLLVEAFIPVALMLLNENFVIICKNQYKIILIIKTKEEKSNSYFGYWK